MSGTIFLCISYSLVFIKLQKIGLLFVMAFKASILSLKLPVSVLHVNFMFLTVIFQTFCGSSFVPLAQVSQNFLLEEEAVCV
jgi:hypothetical protein